MTLADQEVQEQLSKKQSYPEIKTLVEVEREYILGVLAYFEGNREHTLRALGISRQTLTRRLKQYGAPPAPRGAHSHLRRAT